NGSRAPRRGISPRSRERSLEARGDFAPSWPPGEKIGRRGRDWGFGLGAYRREFGAPDGSGAPRRPFKIEYAAHAKTAALARSMVACRRRTTKAAPTLRAARPCGSGSGPG